MSEACNKILAGLADALASARCEHAWRTIRYTLTGAPVIKCDRCGCQITKYR
jgi:hypothetical protein